MDAGTLMQIWKGFYLSHEEAQSKPERKEDFLGTQNFLP